MLKTLVVLPASVISLALQPSAEKACAAGQMVLAMRVFRTSSLTAFAIAAVAAIFFMIFAEQVFGRSFTVASFELQLMMIAAVAEAVAVSLYMRIQAASRMWSSIFAALVPRDLAMLVIVVAFTTKYGLLAAIIAHVVGAIANLVGAYWLSVKSMGSGSTTWPDRALPKP
jgi:hypothetical protein